MKLPESANTKEQRVIVRGDMKLPESANTKEQTVIVRGDVKLPESANTKEQRVIDVMRSSRNLQKQQQQNRG